MYIQQPVDQPLTATDSRFAIALWVLAILMGSSGIKEPVIFFAPAMTPLLTVVWLALYGLAALALFIQFKMDWLFWMLRYRLLLSIALVGALCSAAWAVDLNLSLQRSVHLLGSGLLAIYAGHSLSLPTLLKTLLWTAVTLLVIAVTTVFAFPALGIQGYEGESAWRGIFANKNTLGFWSTMTLALCLCLFQSAQNWSQKILVTIGTLVGLIALFESRSATSLLALLTGLSVIAVIIGAQKLNLGLAQQALLSLLGAATLIFLIQVIDTQWLNDLLGRSGNLTGRSEVWSQTWALILDRPLGGYGYGNLWNPTTSSLWIQETYTNFSWVVYHAHNGLLQIASEIGLVLAGVTALFILQQMLESIHCQDQQPSVQSLFIIAYSVAFLLSNYSEARLMIDRDLFWMLYLAMPISLLRHSTANSPS